MATVLRETRPADAGLVAAAVAAAAQPADHTDGERPAPWPTACSGSTDAADPAELRLDALAAVPGGLVRPDRRSSTS